MRSSCNDLKQIGTHSGGDIMQDQIKPIVTGSYNSEVAIETVIDGITVKAVAYRTIRSHWVEILEPFKVMGAGNGNIPIFAISHTRNTSKP